MRALPRLAWVGILCVAACVTLPVRASYVTKSSTPSAEGWIASLGLSSAGPYPGDVASLLLNVFYETDQRVRFRLTPSEGPVDLTFAELPDSLLAAPTPATGATTSRKYNVIVSDAGAPFAITVVRADSGVPVWQTSDTAASPMVFAQQYLQISNQLPNSNPYVFGLGERDANLRMRFDTPYVLFSQDVAPINSTLNQYGVHPFYLHVDPTTGYSSGVLFWNAHSMEVVLSHSGRLEYKSVGGVLDFFVFLGPSPADVLSQYTELVGRPRLPPLWSIGFHQCRWGYRTANETRSIVEQYISNELPLDAIWNDIDYLHHYNDFTLDPYRYSPADTAAFESWLASVNKRHVYIVDPAIPVADYSPYHRGLEQNVFSMRNNQSAPVWSKVWPPQPVVFPDFTNPATADWWQDNIQQWFELGARADGLWIDMNEPSAFCNGEYPIGCRVVVGPPYSENTTDIPPADQQLMVKWGMYVLQERNRTDYLPPFPAIPLANPPFLPGAAAWGLQSLDDNTLAMSARQNLSALHYNTHSLYGYFESIATRRALLRLNQRRPFVLSRSTFVGSGAFTAHWTGDNQATWESMAISIPHILSFSIFGIPLVGSDICGFNSDTTPELCARWMQLGSFYPFSRNHNTWTTIAQEPFALGPVVLKASRASIVLRYRLLPYLYTLFAVANLTGATVARPMLLEFPNDVSTYELDTQFLLGPAILVCPVLAPLVTTVSPYLPNDDWFLLEGGQRLASFSSAVRGGSSPSLPAPLDAHLPLIVRGGFIIPMANTTALNSIDTMERSDISLVVALQSPRQSLVQSDVSQQRAVGKLYWDDGDSIDPLDLRTQMFCLWSFEVTEPAPGLWTLKIARVQGVLDHVLKRLTSISVYGLPENISIQSAWLGNNQGASIPFSLDSSTNILYFSGLGLGLPSPTDSSVFLSWSSLPPAPGGGGSGDKILSSVAIVAIVAGSVALLSIIAALYSYFVRDVDGYSDLEATMSRSSAISSATSASASAYTALPQNYMNPSSRS